MILFLYDLSQPNSDPISLPPNTYQIGRRSDCDIVLSNDSSVSRQHAKIRVTENDSWIFDFSSYGTLVNGNRLQYAQPQKIKNGDIIRFGTHDYIFKCKFTRKESLSSKKPSFIQSTLASINKNKSTADFNFETLSSPTGSSGGIAPKALGQSSIEKRSKSVDISTLNSSHRISLDKNESFQSSLELRVKNKNSRDSNLFQNESSGVLELIIEDDSENSDRGSWLYNQESKSPSNQKRIKEFKETFGSSIPKSPNLRAGESFSPKRGNSGLKVTRSHILQIVDIDTSEEGNQFYTVEYLDGSVGNVLKEILLLQGYGYLVEEFEGKKQSKRYEDYYSEAVFAFKKRIGYYKQKFAGFWIAVDNKGEVILFNADKDALVEQLKELRQIDITFRKKYLAPFIVSLPSIRVKV